MYAIARATLVLCLAAGGPLLAQGGHDAEPSCRAAFEAFRTGDVEALIERFPTDAEIASMAGDQDVAAVRSKIETQFRRRFDSARREALGWFDLENARYVGVLSAPRAAADLPAVEPLEFLVTDGTHLWTIGGNDVLRTERGWSFVDFLCVRGRFDPREAYEPVLTDEDVTALAETRVELEFSQSKVQSLETELADLSSRTRSDREALESERVRRLQLEQRVQELQSTLASEREARESETFDATLALRTVEVRAMALQTKLERERAATSEPEAAPNGVEGHEAVLALDSGWVEGELLPNEVLEFLHWSQDVRWIVTPSLQAALDEQFEVVELTGTRVEELAASIAGGIAATEEGIVLAHEGELAALLARLQRPNEMGALESRLRDDVVFPTFEAGDEARAVFEQCAEYAGFEVRFDAALDTEAPRLTGRIESRGGLSLWTLLSIAAHDAGLTMKAEDDTLIVAPRE